MYTRRVIGVKQRGGIYGSHRARAIFVVPRKEIEGTKECRLLCRKRGAENEPPPQSRSGVANSFFAITPAHRPASTSSYSIFVGRALQRMR